MKDNAESTRLPYGQGRQALVEAAVRLVARDGLTKLTYRSVTAEAGVSQGSLRHHFPNLLALLEAALEWCVELSQSYMSDLPRVEELLDHFTKMMDDNPDMPVFLTEVFVASRNSPELGAVVRRNQDVYRARVRTVLGKAGVADDVDELVDALVALGDGMVYQRVVFGQEWSAVTDRQVAGARRLLRQLALSPAESTPA
ncbi:TetR family transcriptional regulator [Leifsonia kafniensis]|uniref:TetR family transcriptional regulator n=1 Tax=Leifsonia kafniensis TaxID=475957 RepID=A0ABP7KW12_9MICO